jgi:hypothetical protein
MTNYDENPEIFKGDALIHDIVQQQLKKEGHKITKGDLIDYIYDFFNIELTPKEVHNITLYIKAKKKAHHSEGIFKDKHDIISLEISKIKSRKKREKQFKF